MPTKPIELYYLCNGRKDRAMKLSIIIPTFNSSKVIARALDSIVAQTFGDWEVLIMDGASKDNTLEIAQSYYDERIKTFSEPDKGIYDAMNKGIQKAKGEWLYFLGSDDWLLNGKVLDMVFSMDIDGYDVVYGEAEYEHLPESFHGQWTKRNIWVNRCHQAILYKKKVLIRLGGYNLKYKSWADYDINLKWFMNKTIKNKYIEVGIAHFSSGGCSDGHPDPEFEKDREKLYLKNSFGFWSLEERLSLAKRALQKEKNVFLRFVFRCFVLYLLVLNKAKKAMR